MINFAERYSLNSIPRGADDGGGAGAGDGKGAGAAAGAGDGKGAASGAYDGKRAGAADGPWHKPLNLDPDNAKFIDDHGYTDANAVLKSAREADRLARARNVIEKPDPKNVKDWKGFAELGLPAKVEDYKLAKPTRKDGEIHDEKAFQDFSGAAYGLKLLPWQAEGIFDFMETRSNKSMAEFKTQGAAARNALEVKLREDWGSEYDAKKELASRAAAWAAPDDFDKARIAAH